eukprot:c13150_g1_i3.p1 GENE.c13150_g1_i3~~c13150_g1_i3.p1  ORF type:complete len:101 (+),score=4.19 c13150_g1_i3:793-1095(+)
MTIGPAASSWTHCQVSTLKFGFGFDRAIKLAITATCSRHKCSAINQRSESNKPSLPGPSQQTKHFKMTLLWQPRCFTPLYLLAIIFIVAVVSIKCEIQII